MSRISNRAKVGTYTKFNHKFSLILCLSILPHLLSKPPGESRVSSTTVYLCTRIWILSVAIQVIAATTGLLRSLIPCTREYLASMQHVISFNKETDNPLIKITNSSVVNTPTWHTNPRISTKKMKIQTSALYILRGSAIVCSDWLLSSQLTGTIKWIWGGSDVWIKPHRIFSEICITNIVSILQIKKQE